MKVPLWLGLIVGGALGFALALLFAFPTLKYDPTINLSDITSVVTTLIIAVFIGYYLTRWSRHHRVEKERIIRKTEEVISLTSATRTVIVRFSSGSAEISDVNTAFRDLSASVAYLVNLLHIFGVKPKAVIQKIENSLSAYREAVQSDPITEENRRAFEARGKSEQRQLEVHFEELIREVNRI